MFPDDVDEAEEGEVVATEEEKEVMERGKEDDVGLCSDAVDATAQTSQNIVTPPCFHRSTSLAQAASATTTTTSKSGGHDTSDVIELRV